MRALRKLSHGCRAPYEHAGADHFAQEWGEDIVQCAVNAFARTPP